ncbi:glycosyl transferase family protein [Erwinia amylovora LA635]|nr:glycosyl transferase family protein [Erwinia amylovora LA635]CDK18411.1 hypothetical protein LA636_1419 [Erwinia amylovora LA636]CDK21780.1 glycosyl transferase family protein [Erwinia amylovora LA637]
MKLMRKIHIFKNVARSKGKNFAIKLARLSMTKFFHKTKLRASDRVALFLMPTKGIGDGIIFTGLFKAMNDSGYKVYVLSRKDNSFFYSKNTDISGVIDYDLNSGVTRQDIVDQVGFNDFDILIEMYGDTAPVVHRVNAMAAINARHRLGFNGDGILRACMDHVLEYSELDKHLSHRGTYLMQYLSINGNLPGYQIHLSEIDRQLASGLLNKFEKNFIIAFNPFASSVRRSLSDIQIRLVINTLAEFEDVVTIVIGEKQKIQALNILENDRLIINRIESFHGACAIIELSDMVVTSETSFVHVSNAFRKRMLCLYGSEHMEEFDNNINFGPNYAGATQIFHPNRDAVADIDPQIIISTLRSMVAELKQ